MELSIRDSSSEIKLVADWLEVCPCKHIFPMNIVVAEMENMPANEPFSEEQRHRLKICLEGLLPITFQG